MRLARPLLAGAVLVPAFTALACTLVGPAPVYYAPRPYQPVTYQPPPQQPAPAYPPTQPAYPPPQPEAAGAQTVVQEGGRSITLEHGPAGDPSIVGCADGHREAFLDTQRYPAIAGCLGAWGGRQSLRTAPTGAVRVLPQRRLAPEDTHPLRAGSGVRLDRIAAGGRRALLPLTSKKP